MKIIFILTSLFIYCSAVFAQADLMQKNGHQANLETLAISPDGKSFVSVDHDGKCIIWDITSGREFRAVQNVLAAAFGKESGIVYLTMRDYTSKTIDLAGNTVKSLYAHATKTSYDTRPILPHLYPLANTFLMRGLLIDITTGKYKQMNVKSEHWGVFQDYSPVRNEVAIASYDENGFVTTYNAKSGELLKTYQMETKSRGDKCIKYSADGNLLAVCDRSILQVINLQTGKVIQSFITDRSFRQFAFDPESKKIAWITYDDLVIVDVKTGVKSFSKKHGITDISIFMEGDLMAFQADGKSLLAGNQSNMVLFDAQTGQRGKVFKGVVNTWAKGAYISANGQYLSTYTNDDHAVLWNLQTGAMDRTVATKTTSWLQSDVNNTVYYVVVNDSIREYGSDGILKYRYPAINKLSGAQEVQVSNTGAYIFNLAGSALKQCEEGYSIDVIDTRTRKSIFRRACKVYSAAFAHTSNLLAIKEGLKSSKIDFYEIPSGKLLYSIEVPELDDNEDYINFSSGDKYLQVGKKAYGGGIKLIELASRKLQKISGRIMDEIDDKKNFIYSTCISPDEQLLAIGVRNGTVYFYDITTGKFDETKTLQAHQTIVSGIGFHKSGRFVFTTSYDVSTMKLWNLEKNQLAATIYPNPKAGDWAVISSSGRFDANKGALSNMFHVSGSQIVPLNAMFEKFYTPRILARILEGEQFDPVPDANNLKKMPVVKIQFKEGTRNLEVEDDEAIQTIETKFGNASVAITAECPLDAVTEIRLYQNGKLVETTRNLTVEDEKTGDKKLAKTFQVNLLEGTNRFRAIAFNTERTESRPVELNVVFKKDKTGQAGGAVVQGIQLHVVVVGINTYKNPKYSLNYAEADALAFKLAIENGSTGIFSKVNTYYLKDEKASKAGIIAELEKVKATSKPEDVFIFYYAGHGVVNDKKEFFLVPYDVTQLYGNDGALGQKGLSAASLQQFSKDIKAQKQLYILDACQSAGALDNVVTARGAAEEKAIAQLARSTGTHWLTASGTNQFASEFTKLGHGAFTYCLLQAFKGLTDNGDKKITVKELDAYLQNKVPEITQQYQGAAQYPASYGYGNDFPVILIK